MYLKNLSHRTTALMAVNVLYVCIVPNSARQYMNTLSLLRSSEMPTESCSSSWLSWCSIDRRMNRVTTRSE